jgi:hypothetical protein
MTRFDELLVDLMSGLPAAAAEAGADFVVMPTSVELDLPIEAQVGRGGVLYATLPRGRYDSGFRLPVGRLHARCVVVEDG